MQDPMIYFYREAETRQGIHEVGHMSHKGIAQGALTESGVWMKL